MKILKLQNIQKGSEYIHAEVVIQIRTWWGKTETEVRKVAKRVDGINWKWSDTGQWTPGHDVERLEGLLKIQADLSLLNH